MKATMLWIMSWSSGGTALRLTRVSINDELYQEDEEEDVTIMIIDDSDDLSRYWYWLLWGWGDIIVEILLRRVVFFCVGCGLLLYQSNYTTCKAPMNTDGKDDGGKNVTFQTYSLTCCREQHSYHQRRIHTEESSSKARRILKKYFYLLLSIQSLIAIASNDQKIFIMIHQKLSVYRCLYPLLSSLNLWMYQVL